MLVWYFYHSGIRHKKFGFRGGFVAENVAGFLLKSSEFFECRPLGVPSLPPYPERVRLAV